jgi:N-terminal domain of (some) glycogen debranching enzymes
MVCTIQDTRFVSRLQILLDARRPLLLSSTFQDNNTTLTADLTNIDFYDKAGRLRLRRDTVHILRTKFIWDARVFERLALHNFDDQAHRIRLSLRYTCDFVDLFEVRGQRRPARGDSASQHDRDGVLFTYRGLCGESSGRRSNSRRLRALSLPPRPILISRSSLISVRLCSSPSAAIATTVGPDRSCSSPGCARRDARSVAQAPTALRSRPRTRSLTRCCVAQSPTSAC